MDAAVQISIIAAAFGLITIILQVVTLARLGKNKPEAGRPSGEVRPRFDDNRRDRDNRSRDRGGRPPQLQPREPQQSQPPQLQQQKPAVQQVGGTESSLRDINLRLKNAERFQENARQQVRDLTSDASPTDGNRRPAQPPQQAPRRDGGGREGGREGGRDGGRDGRDGGRHGRDRGRGGRDRDRGGRDRDRQDQRPMGSRPEQSEAMPSAPQAPAPESRRLDSDDTQRYAVKPRMFEEGAPTQGVSQRTVEAPAMPVAEPAPRREPVAAPAPAPAPAPASAPVNAPAADTPAPQPTVFGRR